MTGRKLRRRSPKPAASPADTGGASILVVEDHVDTRDLFVEYLQFHGFRAMGVADGVSAVEEARDVRPDLIVMDLSMPRLDGWHATQRLKTDPRTAHIPILACTAHALGGAVERALAAGVDAYLVKPCEPQELLDEIRRLLARSTRRRRKA